MRSKLQRSALCILLALSGPTLAQETTSESSTEVQAEVAASTTEAAASADAAASAPAAATAPSATADKIGAPQEGKAQVVFFRPSKFKGAAIGFKVREGETELGKLRNGKYFVSNVEPGTHQYTVHSEAKDVLTMEVEAGETYYILGTITMGIMAGRPNLSPSDQATFDSMAAKLELAE